MNVSFPGNFKNGFQLSLWVWESRGNKDLTGLLGLLSSIIALSPGSGAVDGHVSVLLPVPSTAICLMGFS